MERTSTGRSGYDDRAVFNRYNPSGPFSEISAIRMSGFFAAIAFIAVLCFFSFAANHEVQFAIDHQREPLTQKRVIIHHEDSLLFPSRAALCDLLSTMRMLLTIFYRK